MKKKVVYILITLLSIAAFATSPQDDKTKKKNPSKPLPTVTVKDEEIPDALLHPRWKIKKTAPKDVTDLDSTAIDLRMPDNIQQPAEYIDSLNMYVIGSKIGDSYLNTPIFMTPEEYNRWSLRREMNTFFRKKNDENIQAEGKEKFDFSDMKFDLGPAEKIFGPGGVRIKTQGTAELKLGATLKNIDNPSLPIRNRKTTAMDFDEKINLSLSGKVGDKVNMNLNYNTDATFDFDKKDLKLKYEGKEDEIIKLVEAGNVTFPSNSSLIQGASSLFGLRTDLQFGKLKLQTVLSQKNSTSKSVSSKGGTQLTPFELDASDYEENCHFFIGHFFQQHYDNWMSTLPTINSGVTINRVEIWVTNKTGTTSNTRNIVAFADLGEANQDMLPQNRNGNLYTALTGINDIRDIDRAALALEGNNIGGKTMVGGVTFEKLANARLLTSSEYTVNNALGYISLRSTLQTDQVLAIAYEYTYGGQTYQVGEFASDISDSQQALIVKSLKNTSNSPTQSNWKLMMKNVYSLASNLEKAKFKLDIKIQSDTAGTYLTYLPENATKNITLLKALGADRLDNNNKVRPNGYFDYIENYTIANGRVFFPKAEPFGKGIADFLNAHGLSDKIDQYAFYSLYDTTKTAAKQDASHDKYILVGQFKGTSANVISLGAYNVPEHSVVVTAGGVTLAEGTDYSVDYSAGEVTILNQSIIDAGTPVNVSLESNSDFSQQRKTMFGVNWEYDFSKNFQIGGTLQHLREQTLTSKVTMGGEPLNNTLWGVHMNWKKESQWLTNVIDLLPFLHCTQPSQISFTGEFAQLIAGTAGGTQDNASYIDDFENSKNTIDISSPSSWIISSVPSSIPDYQYGSNNLAAGYNRALLAWYYIDPIFTRRGSSLTPAHIRGDLAQLSDPYVREVYVKELYPKRDQSTYSGAVSTLSVLNLAYYPHERGPYNFTTSIFPDGKLQNPANKWGGMMRKLETTDFEAANIEYIEFWLLDPFINKDKNTHKGNLFLQLGELSEDVLRDGKKFYESGMPVDGSSAYETTTWGRVPRQATQTYAFATTSGSRELQDVGFNGLTDKEEQTFDSYMQFNNFVNSTITNDSIKTAWQTDPANDDYHYYRGSDFDALRMPIHQRYKRINMPQGNTPDNNNNSKGFDTSYKTTPDVEDINQDYTLNEYEKYFEYQIAINQDSLQIGHNYIVDEKEYTQTVRDGSKQTVHWYRFRVPLHRPSRREGAITDFSSIRFMRMYLTGFQEDIILRFANLDLVRGEWRTYEHNLTSSAASETGIVSVGAVNIEENTDKKPVNYVLPPGISRVVDPSQPQLVENNEQALSMTVENLSQGESKAVYKNITLDLRQYKRIQMFAHANALKGQIDNLKDNDLSLFVRLGSDYKNNYYEYEIPLKLTPERAIAYGDNLTDKKLVWPEENMLNMALEKFANVKKNRNAAKAKGAASYNQEYSEYDSDNNKNKITVLGNPTLGEIKTMMIGVRSNRTGLRSGEVWVNELRLLESENEGGWAAQGALNVQLSDVGTINLAGRITTEGFGGLEQHVTERSIDRLKSYSLTTTLELGKFFPDKAKVTAPLYYSINKDEKRPKYNPLDSDMKLGDALDAATPRERDSIESIAVTKTTSTNFSLSNVRVGIKTKRHPMPYDPANFSLSYSHSHTFTSGETTIFEKEDNWRAALNYSYTPVYKTFEPFKNIKGKSKWLNFPKAIGLNYLPQNITFNTDITRNLYQLQERDLESIENSKLPLTINDQFLWNREFSIRWDFTKNLHVNFSSATHAEVEVPYNRMSDDFYPDKYTAWKDSVMWQSLRNMGTPLDYNQSFTASYQVPINKIPIFDWISSDASYNATYSWTRGTQLEDGSTLGNTIANNRNLNINATFNMETLYNHVPFLEKVNKESRNSGNSSNRLRNKVKTPKNNLANSAKVKVQKPGDVKDTKEDEKQKKELPKNSRSYVKEITLRTDTTLTINHGKKSRRITVLAKTKDGKPYKLKYKVIDDNQILIKNKDSVELKLTVTPKEPLENQWWYKPTQQVARILMMTRNISMSYRNQYAMVLPGFMPNIGDAFGQKTGSVMAPGLGFAFGLTDESYLDKAREEGWLLNNDELSNPAMINSTTDLQLRVTLEPINDMKIDLSATRTEQKAKSILYNQNGLTTQSGSFNMTTISIGSALSGIGNAKNGYKSATFEKFCRSIDHYRDKVQQRYEGRTYPNAAGAEYNNKKYDATLSPVNKYSADVLVPAFLDAYTSSGSGKMNLFPTLSKLLPNWTIRYSGLTKLALFQDRVKSININHSYKSIYSVGSYNSYSSFMQNADGLGFISNPTTGIPTPSSMFNISTVSINEAFSPLLGVDVTLNNNLTCKVEYRTTRILNLSMTSVQINEAISRDWVMGLGYKISDFNIFGNNNRHKVKGNRNSRTNQNTNNSTVTRNSGLNHDLNLRFDMSYRRQAAITRDIATMTSAASSGNSAWKFSFSADYTLSRMLTFTAYYDRQTNTPLLSSNSYPTTTQDFGLSLKFSLTR